MAKTWDLTCNNYTDEDIAWLHTIKDEVAKIDVSKEKGDEGTPHLQGRITFKRSYRLKGLKKLSGDRFHWEPTKCAQDSLYVKKHDSEMLIIQDNRKGQGTRTDLKAATDAIKEGISMYEMWQQYTTVMIKYERGMKRARDVLTPSVCTVFAKEYSLDQFNEPLIKDFQPIEGRPRSYVFLGPPGIGKSEFIKAHFTEDKPALQVQHLDQVRDYYISGFHQAIIFDDMSFTHLPREAQLSIVSVERDISVHCRHFNADLPKGTVRIFIANEMPFMDDSAIMSRLKIHKFHEALFVDPFVTVIGTMYANKKSKLIGNKDDVIVEDAEEID